MVVQPQCPQPLSHRQGPDPSPGLGLGQRSGYRPYPPGPARHLHRGRPSRGYLSWEVGKIRLNATMTQNVVTYTVEVDTDNSDGKLLPYLTANLKFIVGERKNVLLVPNPALRWVPRPEQIATAFRRAAQKGTRGPWRGPRQASGPGRQTRKPPEALVWVPQGDLVDAVKVSRRPDRWHHDGSHEPRTQARDPVGGGRSREAGRTGHSASPFTPQIFRRCH